MILHMETINSKENCFPKKFKVILPMFNVTHMYILLNKISYLQDQTHQVIWRYFTLACEGVCFSSDHTI